MNKIKVNGNWLTKYNAIQKGVVDTFKGLLSEPRGWCPAFPNIPMEVLGAEDAGVWKTGFLRKKSLQPFQALMVRRPRGQMASLSCFGHLVGSLLMKK